MESHKSIDFNGIIKDIEQGKVLLPDFQRDFKWKDVRKQVGIIASVFARLPIGSILLLNSSNTQEYVANEIGCKHTVDWSQEKYSGNSVSFLLDGQQRLTVLTNVFSDVIFRNWQDWQKDPLHSSLKKRFFLKIPRWDTETKNDIFGVKTLDYTVFMSETPSFLSDDVEPLIHYEEVTKSEFNKDKNEPPYHPFALDTKDTLRQYCLSHSDYYYLPLYLMYSNDSRHLNTYTRIMNSISKDMAEAIKSYYSNLDGDEAEWDAFAKELFGEDSPEYASYTAGESFDEIVELRAATWKDKFKEYLDKCISVMYLSEIVMDDAEKARAINVYERLNEGGVALSTFDLIIAKASSDKRTQGSFKKRFIDSVKQVIDYPENILPDCIATIYKNSKPYENENASIKMGAIDSDDDVISAYSDTFLTVLSIYCYRDVHKFDKCLAYTKKKAILDLSAEDINDNLQLVCAGIDRALFFLQVRCGVRKISEINYKNMITVLAVIFLNEKYFSDKQVNDILEAWYWSSIFSGAYDSDQNTKMESDIKNLLQYIDSRVNGDATKPAWLDDQIKKVFGKEDFSDYDTLAMKKTEAGHYPKDVIRVSLCHYMLSYSYPLLLKDNGERISVFSSKPLDAHHIVPLASNLSEKMSAKEKELSMRETKDSKYNSPLNYVLIDAGENGDISDLPASTYLNNVTVSAKTALKIDHFNPDEIDSFLKYRYDGIKGMLINELNSLVM